MRKNYKLFLTMALMAFVFKGYAQLGVTNFLYPGVDEINRIYHAPYVSTPPTIDGDPTDPAWAMAEWGMAQTFTAITGDWGDIVPENPEGAFTGPEDYMFQYKIVWDSTTYYTLFRIVDDVHIYSDFHAGYPGQGASYPFGGRPVWNQEHRPAIGAGDGSRYDAWRMDQVQFHMTSNDPAYETTYNRNTQGIFHVFFPGYHLTTNPDTAVIVANKAAPNVARYNPTAAHKLIEGDAVYIEMRDTIWSFMVDGFPTFGPQSTDTLLMNMEINEADGTTNRGDYKLYISSTEGNGNSNTKEWMKIVLVPQDDTSVPNIQNVPELQVYPNPNTTGVMHMNREASIRIYSMTGQEMMRSENSQSVDISSLKTGIFLVRDMDSGQVTKLIKR